MFGFLFGPDPSILRNARDLVDAGAVLLDVRTPMEFSGAHVDGAVNIPVQSLAQRLHELPAKDHPIVVYCRSGGRSASAKAVLEGAGFTNVVDVGPMPPW